MQPHLSATFHRFQHEIDYLYIHVVAATSLLNTIRVEMLLLRHSFSLQVLRGDIAITKIGLVSYMFRALFVAE